MNKKNIFPSAQRKQLTSLVHFCQGFLSANGYELHQKRGYPQDMSLRQTPKGQSIQNTLESLSFKSVKLCMRLLLNLLSTTKA